MNIKDGIVHPLVVLSNSSKPISTVEQRQYLYEQERQLEKSVRYQKGISDSINKLVNSKENQIKYILEYQSNKQNTQMQAIEDIGWGINGLGDKIDYGMAVLSNGIQQLNENQIIGFKNELKALGIVNYSINQGFNNLLNSIDSQTIIFKNVSSQIGEIIESLHNPRKIEGLEYKKDAINNLQNKWFDEALLYLKLAAEKLITDQEIFFLIGLIEFEENKNYNEAIINFEKAIKYSKGNNDNDIYIQSLDKAASVYFILEGEKGTNNNSKINIALDYQIEALKVNKKINTTHIYDLLKYSAILSEYSIFEMFLYKLLKINPSFILDISIEPIFSKNSNILEIIDEVIERIETEREEERIEKEEKKLEEQKNIEYNMNLNELKNKLKKNEEDLDYEYIKQNSYNIKSNSGYTSGDIKNNLMCTIGDKLYSVIDEKLEIIAYNYKDIQLTNGNYSIIRKDIFNFYLVDNLGRNYYNYSFNIIYSKGSYLICDSSSEQRLVLNDGTLLTGKNNLTNVFFSHFDYNKGYALFYATGNLVPGYGNVYYRYIYKIDKNGNTTLVKTFQTYGNFDEFEHINKFNNNINELNLNSEIIYKNVKINGKFNFIKKDGILLVKSPSYNKLLTLIDNYEKLIKNHLVKEFNSETGEGEIKLLNNYYKVIRNKNDYGYYDYKIDF